MVIAAEILDQLMPYHCFFEPEAELRDLLTTFEATPRRSFLEIGTHRGFTCAAIAIAFPEARVVTLDLPDSMATQWNPLPSGQIGDAYRALGMTQRIEQLLMDSSELWRLAGKGEAYDLVFVDADHSPDAVFRDLILAADLLPKGEGVLVAHDYTDVYEPHRPAWTVGVQKAVDQFLKVRPFRKRRLAGLLVALERDTPDAHTMSTYKRS
jgi:predicted O-methyltransferase YrrM